VSAIDGANAPEKPGPLDGPRALDDEGRASILERAIRLDLRSLAQYLARSAPPNDAAKRPEVLRALESIARAEEDGVKDLVQRMEEIGVDPALSASYDARFPTLNYVSCAYGLGALERRFAADLTTLDALAKEAGDDLWAAPALAEARARKSDHLALVAKLRAAIEAKPASR